MGEEGGGSGTSNRKEVRQELNTWRLIALFLACTVIALAIGLGSIYTTRKDYNEVKDKLTASRQACPASGLDATVSDYSVAPPSSTYNATNAHPLEDLYPQEVRDIIAFLKDQSRSGLSGVINMTGDVSDLSSNFIWAMELLMPDKTTTVNWLTDKVNTKPARYALVVIMFGAEAPAFVGEYKVGPLPVNQATTATLHRSIDWLRRPISTPEYAGIDPIIEDFLSNSSIAAILLENYGVTDPLTNLTWTDISPRGLDGTYRRTWFFFMFDVEGAYATNLGLEVLVDHSDDDPSNYEITQIAFNNIAYDNITEFAAAYAAMSNADKHKFQYDPSDPYNTLASRGTAPDGNSASPPRQYNPAGIRFSVSGKEVSFLGWKFLIASTFRSGLSFRAITFKGESIVYELAQQTAAATYSGRQPSQALSQYDDSGWGMGASSFPLMRGTDCPDTAMFLDIYMLWDSSDILALKNGVCLFEEGLSISAVRHFGKNSNFDGVGTARSLVSTRLVVRTALTVYNYDYMMSHFFYPDGTIEVSMEATGYMQAARWFDTSDDIFGTRVHYNHMGSLHDHILGYKVDLDILGTANSLQKLAISFDTFPSNNYLPSSKLAKKITKSIVANESVSTFRLNPDAPTFFNFINSDAGLNKWNVTRGYRLDITSKSNSIQPFDTIEYGPAFSWMKYNLAVTKYKATEPRSAEHNYDMQAVSDPLVKFSDFLNGENLVQQDLVAWVSFGLMHIPHSEDIPVTTTPASSIGFALKPFNFFDETPLMALTTGVTVQEGTTDGSAPTVTSNLELDSSSQCYQSPPDYTFPANNAYSG